ncbi:MAG: CRISPR-associated protein Cas4 [Chloroflexota bacterium]|nr:CRISPR-associated protein Cas4 [Chloroflexota bacterium]
MTDLKQWVYCPRILYYHYCLPDVRPVTYKMKAGSAAGLQEEERENRRSLRAYGLEAGRREFNIPIASIELGLRGKVDMAIWVDDLTNAEVIPVDYKLSRRMGKHFALQLLAYGLMLAETSNTPSQRGFLYSIPERRAHEIKFTKHIRSQLKTALKLMHQTLQSEAMPAPTPQRKKCVTCEFRRFCNDIL